jgi:prevent-host-death family protein
MKTITVAELRQNPTAALADVEAGESYIVTRHRRPVARLVPPDADGPVRIVPAKNPGPSNLSALPPRTLKTAESVDELIADMQSPW